MNAIHIIGNLVADPDIRTVAGEGGTSTVCNFTVAVNRAAGGKKITDYFRVSIWNNWAQSLAKYLKKGGKIAVSGSVTSRPWVDQKGVAHSGMEIVGVQFVELLGGKKDAEGESGEGGAGTAEPGGFAEVDDTELPF